MAKPLTLPPVSDIQVTELRQLYDTTTHANLRLRYQMILLAHQGRSVAEIAAGVFRSRDTVERVLKRFLRGGVAAIPPRKAPGMASTVTPAWKAELLRVIDLDPHTVGISSANWTTGL
jgi:transposase